MRYKALCILYSYEILETEPLLDLLLALTIIIDLRVTLLEHDHQVVAHAGVVIPKQTHRFVVDTLQFLAIDLKVT